MINRAKMPRQLRGKGGITNVTPRTNFLLGGIKRRIRKLIPNELANVAVKAAPFVAPFNPAIAGLMRGIGRFDQRGSLSDALKQGLATTAFGAGTRFLGGADQVMGGGLKGGFTSPLSSERTQAIGDLFDKQKSTQLSDVEKAEQGLDIGKKSIRETIKKTIKKLPRGVAAQLAAGTVTAGASLLASYFQGEFREQEPGETMEEYLAARRDVVGKQMRTYMDNYFKFDPEYSALDDAGKNAFVARYNVRDGGRIGYQTGGISMANTLAQNRAINEAQRQAVNQTLQKARNTQKATGILDAAMRSADPNDPGGSLTNIYNQYFRGRNTGVPAGTFNMGNRKMSYTASERDNIIRGIASQLGNQTTYKPTPPTDPLTGMLQSQMLPNMADGSMRSLAEEDAIRQRVLAAQAAQEGNKPTFQERLMGESWETLSDNDQYRIAMEYPGETPPRRNPNFVPGLAKGGMPTGIMRTNKAGVKERDYRDKGGFVPVGIKEKADDVPAMLSKNEFVMTANAVRGAGGGSIEKGAQRMYDTMKKLEKRVV